MGTVWRAHDELLGRDVAVKELVFPPGLGGHEKEVMRGRVMREARTAARLSHPGVVRIFDVVEAEERPWIVMELIPSARSLSEILKEEGSIAPARAALIGLEVLAGLSAAHAAGVLHRDVKPSNILIAPDGRAVLGDFGIAVAEGEPTLTRAGVLIGSPAYLSPEQAHGRPLTPASDLWSLGATLYTAVEGRTPFHRENVMATLTAIITDPPDEPTLAGPLWPVIEGLLRKDPADRLDAVALAQALTETAAQDEADAAPREATEIPGDPAEPSAVPHKMPVGRPHDAGAGSSAARPGPADADADPARDEGITSPQAEPLSGPAADADADADSAGDERAGSLPSPPVEPGPGPASDAVQPSVERPRPVPEQSGEMPPSEERSGDARPPEHGTGDRRPPGERSGAGGPQDEGAGAGRPQEEEAGVGTRPGEWAGDGRPVPPGRRTRRGRMVAVLSIVLLIGAAGVVTFVLNNPSHRAGLTGTGKTTGRTTPSAKTPSTASTASTRSGSSGASPRQRDTASPTPSPGGAALPADFRRYEDDSGFSIGVPRGWKVSHDGGYVYVRDPGSSRYLLIDQTSHPKSDPLADWRQQDAYRRGSDNGYTRIRLAPVTGYFKKAADLEFLHSSGGGKLHVLNRNILVNGHRAYALYWSTPASQWSGSRRYFDVFAASFRPAP